MLLASLQAKPKPSKLRMKRHLVVDMSGDLKNVAQASATPEPAKKRTKQASPLADEPETPAKAAPKKTKGQGKKRATDTVKKSPKDTTKKSPKDTKKKSPATKKSPKDTVKKSPHKDTVMKKSPNKDTVMKKSPHKDTAMKKSPNKDTAMKKSPNKDTAMKKSPNKDMAENPFERPAATRDNDAGKLTAIEKRQQLADRNAILVRNMCKLLPDAQPPLGFTAKTPACTYGHPNCYIYIYILF